MQIKLKADVKKHKNDNLQKMDEMIKELRHRKKLFLWAYNNKKNHILSYQVVLVQGNGVFMHTINFERK